MQMPESMATARRSIETITAEIQFYKSIAGEAILEIGQRLIEAKAQLGHGEWLGWLGAGIDFSEATAQRFMRLAREYPNPSALTDLGASKALILLALPPGERESFAEENDAAAMSTRELEKAVRERAEALELRAQAEAEAAEAKRSADEYAAALALADQRAADARAELERLRDTAPAVIVEGPDQQTIKAYKKEAAKAAKKEAENQYREKMAVTAIAQENAEKRVADAERERDELKKRYEDGQAAATERIARLEKRLEVSSSEAIAIFKVHFEAAQGCVNNMLGCMQKLDDVPETRGKLAAALRALCEKTLAGLPNDL
jgi:hypothetical protein